MSNCSALFLYAEKNVHVQKSSAFSVHVHEILHVCTKNYVHILIAYFMEQDIIMYIFLCTCTKIYKYVITILYMYKIIRTKDSNKCTNPCTKFCAHTYIFSWYMYKPRGYPWFDLEMRLLSGKFSKCNRIVRKTDNSVAPGSHWLTADGFADFPCTKLDSLLACLLQPLTPQSSTAVYESKRKRTSEQQLYAANAGRPVRVGRSPLE